jgi:hypothetical protein
MTAAGTRARAAFGKGFIRARRGCSGVEAHRSGRAGDGDGSAAVPVWCGRAGLVALVGWGWLFLALPWLSWRSTPGSSAARPCCAGARAVLSTNVLGLCSPGLSPSDASQAGRQPSRRSLYALQCAPGRLGRGRPHQPGKIPTMMVKPG